MKRNLKALGLALVAAFALSVVAASAASAKTVEFTQPENKYPVLLTGHEEGEVNVFRAAGGAVECDKVTFTGTEVEDSNSVTITPHYDECEETKLGLNAEIHMNSCVYTFTAGEATSTKDVHGSVHLECDPGDNVEITIGSICTVHVEGNQTIGGITYTNIPGEEEGETPKDWVTVHVDTGATINYIETEESVLFCPMEDETTHEDGEYESNVILKGYEDNSGVEGNPLDIDVKTNE